jgi:hypothetical protein
MERILRVRRWAFGTDYAQTERKTQEASQPGKKEGDKRARNPVSPRNRISRGERSLLQLLMAPPAALLMNANLLLALGTAAEARLAILFLVRSCFHCPAPLLNGIRVV